MIVFDELVPWPTEEVDDILYGVGHKQREALILAAMDAIGPKRRGELKAEWLRRVLAKSREMEEKCDS